MQFSTIPKNKIQKIFAKNFEKKQKWLRWQKCKKICKIDIKFKQKT